MARDDPTQSSPTTAQVPGSSPTTPNPPRSKLSSLNPFLWAMGIIIFLTAFFSGFWALFWYLPLSDDDHHAIVQTYIMGVGGSLMCLERICSRPKPWKWLLSIALLLTVLGITLWAVIKYTFLPYSQKVRLAVALGTKGPCIYLEWAMYFAVLGRKQTECEGALFLLSIVEISTTVGVIAVTDRAARVWAYIGYLVALLLFLPYLLAMFNEGNLPQRNEGGEEEEGPELDLSFGI